MSFITFQCYACGKSLKVSGDKAGRRAKCNQCGTVLTIPVPSTATEAATPPAQAPTPTASYPAAPARAAAPVAAPLPGIPIGPAAPSGDAAPAAVRKPVAPRDGGSPSPSVAPQDEEYSPDASAGPSPERWPKLRRGLLLVFIAAGILGGGTFLEAIGYFLLSVPAIQLLSDGLPSASPGAARTVLAVGALVSFMAGLTALAGYALCMLAPDRRGSAGLAIAGLSTAGVAALLDVAVRLPSLFSPYLFEQRFITSQGFFLPWFLLLLAQLLFGAQLILACFLGRAVALGLKKKKTAKSSLLPVYLIGGYTAERLLTFLFWYLAATLTHDATRNALAWTSLVLLWLGMALFVAGLVVYTIFLWRVYRFVPEK